MKDLRYQSKFDRVMVVVWSYLLIASCATVLVMLFAMPMGSGGPEPGDVQSYWTY